MAVPMMNQDPRQAAIGRMQQGIVKAPTAPAVGQPPAGGQPGGGTPPAVTAIKMLQAIASRLGQMGYKEQADKLAQAISQVEAVIEEIKNTVGQGGGKPQPGAQPAPAATAPVPAQGGQPPVPVR